VRNGQPLVTLVTERVHGEIEMAVEDQGHYVRPNNEPNC